MKKIILLAVISAQFISCKKSGESLEGKLYNSSYVYIQFQLNGQYETFQKTSREDYARGCFGKGTWTYKKNKITINPNDSECDSNRIVAGQYTLDGSKLSNSSSSYTSSYEK